MIKKYLSPILIIIAMAIHILNFDFSTGVTSKEFLFFAISIVIMIIAIVLLIRKSHKA